MSDLRLSDVSVRLGNREVLRGVNFTAKRGEVLGILGPNGAGKTTLLRATLGLVAYSGEISLHTRALNAFSALERAKQVAYVPQQSELRAPLSVREVVELGRYAHQTTRGHGDASDAAAIARALADCDLQGFEERRFTRLSGGEQRRVLLARALATEAPWILLDEPTAALDIPHALALVARARALANTGRGILVVLHNLDEARQLCDRVVLLNNGSVYAEGPVEEIIVEPKIRDVFGVELIRGAGLGYKLPLPKAEGRK